MSYTQPGRGAAGIGGTAQDARQAIAAWKFPWVALCMCGRFFFGLALLFLDRFCPFLWWCPLFFLPFLPFLPSRQGVITGLLSSGEQTGSLVYQKATMEVQHPPRPNPSAGSGR